MLVLSQKTTFYFHVCYFHPWPCYLLLTIAIYQMKVTAFLTLVGVAIDALHFNKCFGKERER
jgi:hypothetical protein